MVRDQPASDQRREDPGSGRVVIVGAVTRDIFEDREASGGAVSFAARVADAFGPRARILTAGAREDAETLGVPVSSTGEPVEGGADSAFAGHEVHWLESQTTLTYRHRFHGAERELTLLARPDRALTRADLPEDWADPDVLVLAPLLADDIDIASFRSLTSRRECALLAQGLLREVALGESVGVASGYPYALFGATSPETSIFLSAEETQGWPRAAMEAVWSASRRVVVTRGQHGAEVRSGLRRFHAQPAPARSVVDSTGAGDVFATAFILALAAGDGEEQAARLASVYAAASIEQQGTAPLPPLEEARRRVEALTVATEPERLFR